MKKLFHQPLYKLGCFTKNRVVSRRVILGALLSLMTLPIFAETSNSIGVFSVSATKVVTFSPGNLQYHPKNQEWRFAENQYDIIGEDNKNISTDYDGWIDLFGWSASDGSAKFGVSSSENNNDYVGDFVDWGKNQIGSDAPDTWRTMTMDEWCYLCNTRMKADSLRGLGRINGVAGLILLPDNWTCPVGVTFDYYKVQSFTINEWSRLEAEGAVFLPCAGFRYGSDVNSVNSRPTYWSSTEREEGITAYYINLVDRKEASYYLYTGLSVRLVKDVVRLDQDTHPIHVDTTTTKVTSTLGQTISKAVRINISDLLGSNITITGTSDNSAFTVVDLENVSSGEQNLIVNYTPTAVTDGIETATITLYNSTLEGSTSFTMTGRHLPAEFAIISKIGDQWYALPSDNPNATAVLVSVDDDTNPTMGVTMTPENVKWSLKTPNNSAVDRFVLTNPNNQYLNADANGALQMNTTYNNCEWQPVTDDLNEYQLTNAGNTKELGISQQKIFGTLDDNISDVVRLVSIYAETSNGIGVFSVSATKVVTFSPGNLQYHPKNQEWRFAPSQLDYVGEGNHLDNVMNPSYDGWLDLFGWSTEDSNYGLSATSDDYAGHFVDWGTNQIGDDAPNTWRTLTHDEWHYLRYTRTNAENLLGVAQVDGVNGLILLPDNWACPAGVTFKSGFHSSYGVEYYAAYQTFTADQWSKLESAGAVFLPAAGIRRLDLDKPTPRNATEFSRIWSATESESNNAYYFYCLTDKAYMYHTVRSNAHSVRLAQDTHPIKVDATTTKVTSTTGQTIRKSVRINISNLITRNATNQTTTITGTSDNPAFTVVALENVSSGEQNLIVNYTPTAVTDGIETATITLYSSTLEGSTSFTMTGRHLPAEFAIISKIGDQWYALPSDNPNATAVLVSVDDDTNPTMGVTMTPENVKWSLKRPNNSAVDRFVLTNPNNQYLNADANGALQMNTTYNNCEWQPATDDLKEYQLTNAGNTKNLGISQQNIFGTLDDNRSVIVRLVSIYPEKNIGLFSVSETKQVTFSPGNLQYHPKNREWRFAPHQWDNIGTSNTLTNFKNPEYDDWLDLFCWSAEGTNSGLDISADFSGNFVDWGNNTISGYAPNTWRTMTIDEWEYLLNGRPNATDLRAAAQVNGVNGWIFLPDNWSCPAGITFSPGGGYANNIFDIDQWLQIEEAGAIFLPSAGIRRGNRENTDNTNSYGTNAYGRYWTSSTISNGGNPYYFYILNDDVWGIKYSTGRNYAQSVRLAQDIHPIQVDATTTKVTSTVGQTISKAVRINISDLLGSNITITGTSDNSAFEVVTLENVSSGEQNLIVNYTPTAVTDGIETATITLSLSCGTIENLTSFTMTGRYLAQNFVIAAKAGNEWVAMTAKVSNGTQVAVPIKVDDTETPTKATIALNTCQYQLLGLEDRFNANGTAVHLYSTQTEKVLNASTSTTTKTYLNTGATHDNAEKSDTALFYEWQLVTSDLIHYAITNCNTQNTENRVLGYSSSTGEWGLYQSSNVVNQEVFLLPIETTLTEKDIEVMEWGTNSMALRFGETAPTNMNVTLGETTTNVTLTNLNSSDIYLVDNLSGLTNNNHEVMVISYNGQGTFIRKPILVSGDVVSTNYSTLAPEHRDVVVLNGGKLNAGSAHVNFANIYVYPGGKLVLDGKSLGVKQQVYLRGGYSWLNQTTYALPEVYLNGTINFNGSGNMIYDYYIQNYKYYQFCLPYTVPLAKVTDEAGVDNFPVWVKHYNGALRAANAYATSWEYYNGDNFEAGKGYIIAAKPRQVDNVKNRPLSIIRFPLGNNSITSSEADKSVATTAHGIDDYNNGKVTANNVGWNFVGNPFLATWKGDIGHKQLEMHYENGKWDGSYDWVESNIKYITVMSAESGSEYDQHVAIDIELKPFFPFYMQETADGGSGMINFAATGRMKKAPIMLSAKTKREAFVQIEIMTGGEKDQTGMFIGEHYSDDIDFDDYEKMFGSSTDNTKLWLMHEGKRMAFEAMTESTAAAYTSLGYRAPKKGTYYMDVNLEVSDLTDVEAIYLSDNLSEVSDYDLLEGAYEFESDATTYNDNRFVVRVVLRNEAPGTATDIENIIGIHSDSESPCKFIYQNRMYILRNGIIYDMTGQQVLTIEK